MRTFAQSILCVGVVSILVTGCIMPTPPPTPTPTHTLAPTATTTATPTFTATPLPTLTPTPTQTQTRTPAPTPTLTPAPTARPTLTGALPSACSVSTDATYGHTLGNPIRVGNTNLLDGPARERAYLDALRGPNGETLAYRRVGSFAGARPIDGYEVTFAGLGKPLMLYIDMYNFAELQAPVGLICATPFPLRQP